MFQKFEYSKDWRNPSDFPTVEADETQVRADMQLLFTEARNAIWALVEALADQNAAANIGAEDGGKTVTLQSLLEALRSDEHSHKNLSGLEDLVTAFAGLTLATSITNDETKIPTAKAVYDYIVQSGNGDMMTAIYDPTGKTQDIFAFTEAEVSEHANKNNNPHGVTADQVGLGHVDDTADVDKPVSKAVQEALDKKVNDTDVIPVARGGTGAKTAAEARNALGLGNTSGAVPIANGGTGATTAAAARKNLGLGNTSGALPVANGGTGATSAADACGSLGAVKKSGDTMSGKLTNKSTIVIQRDTYPTLYFDNTAGKSKAAVICAAGAADSNGGVILRGWNADGNAYKDLILTYANSMAVPVINGGTGATTTYEAVQKLFKSDNTGGITSYPTAPGIYRTTGVKVCTNSQSNLSGYGVLVIFQSVYAMHIYLDSNGTLIFGYSGDTFQQPSFWYRVSAA